jgi:hypothetical protein
LPYVVNRFEVIGHLVDLDITGRKHRGSGFQEGVASRSHRPRNRFAWTALAALEWNSFCDHSSFVVPSALMTATNV